MSLSRFMYIDHRDGEGELPSAEELRKYAIVIVTIKRISKEAQKWARQTQHEIIDDLSRLSTNSTENGIVESDAENVSDGEARSQSSGNKVALNRSALRKINWLRVVVDEGHQLGNSSSIPQYVEFIRDIIAERRWILSGTPAKETTTRASLQSVFGILCFLRHEPFGKEGGMKVWRKYISQPFLGTSSLSAASAVSGFRNLTSTLREIMVRHLKEDVELDLPKLKKRTVYLDLIPSEKLSYNTIVTIIRSNVGLTSIDPAKGWAISFLNPKNAKRARIALRNIRLACQGQQNTPFIAQKAIYDFVHELEKHRVDEAKREQIFHYINDSQNGMLKECMKCGIHLPILHVTPCVHFFCAECFMAHFQAARKRNDDAAMNSCMICNQPLNASEFAMFQPGIDIKWRDDEIVKLRPGSKAEYIISRLESIRKENPHAKCLIHSSFNEILNIVGTFLIHHFGQDSIAEYWGKYQDTELAKFCTGLSETWTCPTCGYEKNDPLSKTCNLNAIEVEMISESGVVVDRGNSNNKFRLTIRSDSVPNWIQGQVFTKDDILYVPLDSIRGLNFDQVLQSNPNMDRNSTVRVRVVNSKKCRGKVPSRDTWEQHRNNECFVMLLHSEGAVGLDLSMVTHIFLTDRIPDPAVEDQVISRAFRIGSHVKEIVVEQLIGKGTIEEQCPPGTSYGDIIKSMIPVI